MIIRNKIKVTKNVKFEVKFDDINGVRSHIACCQENNHIQQVAFSTYHNALTQVCFTCKVILTSMRKEDLI
ncbi:MAG: hypothetical protein ACOC56_02290 [Atribacterota bacterium]